MNPKNIVALAQTINKLKTIKRTGWIREDIENPESVSDHSHGLAILAMIIGKYFDVNREKLIKMALLHDVAEAEIGDWVAERGRTVDKASKSEKEKKEEEIINKLFNTFGTEYADLFREMIERKTKEAKLFWQLDKLEMAIQANDYQKSNKKDLTEFFENTKMHVVDPELKKIFDEIISS